MIEWIQTNWDKILQVFGAVVAVISLVVKLFATDKTKGVWANVLKVLSVLSLVNPDGSVIGKKTEEDK